MHRHRYKARCIFASPMCTFLIINGNKCGERDRVYALVHRIVNFPVVLSSRIVTYDACV